ncbi:ABC transporter substrate-binding protein [Alphaproteobacteria bacterium]|nr:ABC transporter substrate-binding protein [Alphaproteobacteria bacterium]
MAKFLKILILPVIFIQVSIANASNKEYSHGISVFGDLKYPKNFKNFAYANPDSLKYGTVRFGVEGGFNSLNPFILKGLPASGLNYLYDSLGVGTDDEIQSRYGLIAQGIYLSSDKMFMEFILNPKAKFSDGKKITADDVVFSFNKFVNEGHPSYKMMYRDVKEVIKINDYLVRFNFKNNLNRDLPILVSSLTIIPKHYYQKIDFNKTTLEIPLGSGPYKIKEIHPNRSIVYELNEDYWAKDLSVNKGHYNFKTIIYDYYRDPQVLIEAFKAQKYDLRIENVARNWANSYNIDAVKKQQIIKKEIIHSLPAPAQTFVLNLRKDKFQNIALRKAINYVFDFEWLKQHIFYGSYARTNSYFANSDYGFPISNSKQVLTIRENLILAQKTLLDAGYKIEDGKLFEPSSNRAVELEFLIDQKTFEMIIAPFVFNLKKLGIDAKVKFVEENQYQTRVNNFDYDIITAVFPQSAIPGSELYSYFHSSQKDIKGSRNLIGLSDKYVDQIILKILNAKSKETLKIFCKELDKYLLENYFTVLQWYNNSYRILHRDIFIMPKINPKYGLAIDTWSIKTN